MNQVKEIDDGEAQIFMSGIYEKLFQRESLNFNTLYPSQMKEIIDQSGTAPDMITFQIPNQGLINVADTHFSFKMKVLVGNTLIGDQIIQQNCKLFKRAAAGGTITDVCTMPVSARCFMRDV